MSADCLIKAQTNSYITKNPRQQHVQANEIQHAQYYARQLQGMCYGRSTVCTDPLLLRLVPSPSVYGRFLS